MSRVYIASDNIFSPLGNSTAENFDKVMAGATSLRVVNNQHLSSTPFVAAMFSDENFFLQEDYTRFESYCIASIKEALNDTEISLSLPETIFILSTTKGNIELIENPKQRNTLRSKVSLSQTAKRIASHFGASNSPLVISNACISGVLSVMVAKRLLETGQYRHAVVTGADVLSKFIISGFQSLQAMSSDVCKPFDKNRSGINLGECAATIVLTAKEEYVSTEKKVVVNGNASSNDANHISGPSRTGEELAGAVLKAMSESGLSAEDLAFISAHGTATLFNDEMEAKAFTHASLSSVPLHSLKGHFGHTLGAAGVVESIISYQSLLNGVILPSKNFEEMGVSGKINISQTLSRTDKNHTLKTASGFGGCNAAIVYSLK